MCKRNLNIIYLILTIFILQGCSFKSNNCIKGKGPIVSREIKVDTFEELLLDGPFNYSTIPSNSIIIIVKGKSNILDSLNFRNENKKLRFGFNTGYYCLDTDIELEIYSPKLNKITLKDISHDLSESPVDLVTDSAGLMYLEEGTKRTKIN